jgi:hypothetical protein
MATSTITFLPIFFVLKNKGSMRLDELTKSLCDEVPVTFGDGSNVERDIETYIECLTINDGLVRFNSEARTYAKISMMERDIQRALHGYIEDMEKFQLYEYKTRENSHTCHIGVPWDKIPVDDNEKRYKEGAPMDCDFRNDGEDACRLGCGVDQSLFE